MQGRTIFVFLIMLAALFAVYKRAESPKDYEECILKNVAGTKNVSAVRDIQSACDGEFPGRRSPDGNGYIYDVLGYGIYKIAGPIPTQEEREDIKKWKNKVEADLVVLEKNNLALEEATARINLEEREKRRPILFDGKDLSASRILNARVTCGTADHDCILGLQYFFNFTFFNGSSDKSATDITVNYIFVTKNIKECPEEGYYEEKVYLKEPVLPRHSEEVSFELPESIGSLRVGGICRKISSINGH